MRKDSKGEMQELANIQAELEGIISNEGARDNLSLEDSVRPSPLSLHSTSPLAMSGLDQFDGNEKVEIHYGLMPPDIKAISAHMITGIKHAGITEEELSRVLEVSHEDDDT